MGVRQRVWRQAIALFAVMLFGLVAPGCNANEFGGVKQVTLEDLLAYPQKYAGERVTVMGYLAEHANLGLFLSREHAMARDFQSSIVVSECDDRRIGLSRCVDNTVSLTADLVMRSSSEFVLVDASDLKFVSTGKSCMESDSE